MISMNNTYHYLYKIYYGNGVEDILVYLGRTNQKLKDRLRCHFFKKPIVRVLDLKQVSKIEYAEFKTEADMFLYEIYYINKYKPPLNVDDVAKDDLTVELPEVTFIEYKDPIIDKWRKDLFAKSLQETEMENRLKVILEELSSLREQYHSDTNMSENDYYDKKEALEKEYKETHKKLYGK